MELGFTHKNIIDLTPAKREINRKGPNTKKKIKNQKRYQN